MSLWRLEWLRLVRTRRLPALVAVYLFFGLLGPTTARYLGEIVERFAEDVSIRFPDPVPADGIAQFTSNANQIGLLVAILITASALVVDAVPEMAIFLRTRVHPTGRILWPRLVASYGVVSGAFVLGLGAAAYQTTVLLGAPAWAPLIAGAVFTLVYLAFVVALVAAVGSRTGSLLATVAVTVVILLALPIISVIDAVGRWSPSHLLGALDAMVRDDIGWMEFLPATAVTVVITLGLLSMSLRRLSRREL